MIAASPSCYQLPFQATLEPQRPASSDALGTAAMSDPLRLSPDEARAIYQHGFETWSALHAAAKEQPRWPSSYLNLHAAFRHHPSYPSKLRLKHVEMENTSVFLPLAVLLGIAAMVESMDCQLSRSTRILMSSR